VGAAETGSGKTLAFGIPVFQRLMELRRQNGMPLVRSKGQRASELKHWAYLPALILTPTRELALQIKCVYGGACVLCVCVVCVCCVCVMTGWSLCARMCAVPEQWCVCQISSW
jgi:superfamily II DNA/RNA helicase